MIRATLPQPIISFDEESRYQNDPVIRDYLSANNVTSASIAANASLWKGYPDSHQLNDPHVRHYYACVISTSTSG